MCVRGPDHAIDKRRIRRPSPDVVRGASKGTHIPSDRTLFCVHQRHLLPLEVTTSYRHPLVERGVGPQDDGRGAEVAENTELGVSGCLLCGRRGCACATCTIVGETDAHFSLPILREEPFFFKRMRKHSFL